MLLKAQQCCVYLIYGKLYKIEDSPQSGFHIGHQIVVVDDLHGTSEVMRPLRVHLLPGSQFVFDELLPV